MKKLLALALVLLMTVALLPAVHPHTAKAEETSGKCGKDICWSLNENTGVVSLSGSGETFDYEAGWQDSPFRQYSGQIKEIVVGEGITKIGHDVFAFCSEVTKVTLPSTLRTLGGFKRCDSLNEVFIPYGVETILKDAFSHSGVQAIVLPETVNNVETHAFYGCHELRMITMPSHMDEIGVEAFWDCINLESIVIPEGITTISYGAFQDCESLQNVLLPFTLNTIECQAFARCTELASIVIPEGVTSFDIHAFSTCSSLLWISLPESLELVRSEAFQDCKNLTNVYYAGTEEQRNRIDIVETNNNYLLSAGWHYSCSTPEDYTDPVIVYSDEYDKSNRFYVLYHNDSIEDVVFSTESTTYNPKLAHFLAVMARAAYSENRIRKNYDKLKLENTQVYHYEDSDPVAGYTIGEKTVGDRRLVMITIRGTNGWSEWLETNFNLGVYSTVYSHGWHSGFNASASTLFEALQARYGDGMTDPNTTYVITGHSLGGAVGNLLSVKLYEAGVSNKNVYDYNFACPNVGMGPDNVNAWNGDGVHNNIINICNWCDWVPSLPGLFSENMSGMNHVTFPLYWQKWKKYGVTYWFDAGFQFFWEAHDMGLYVDWAANESDETHYKDIDYKVTAVMACCPVDVTILDSNGNPVAGTDSESKCYYGYQEGEKAVILVNGDKKLFYLIGDDDWIVQIHATDEGSMDFGVARVYLHGNDVDETITFETVNLTEGKAFISEIDQDAEISDVKLYVVDENGAPIREVHEDGTETPVTQTFEGQCGDELYWSFDKDTGTLTITGSGEMWDYEGGAMPWEDVTVEYVDSYGGAALRDDPTVSLIHYIILPEGLTSIASGAFAGTLIESVEIPSTVKKILYMAFADCENLKSIAIPDGVTSIGWGAFSGCTGLGSVTISNSVICIADYMFYGCTNLLSVTIPSGVTSIGESVFEGCFKLTEITIPNSVTSIGDRAFTECTALTDVYYGGSEAQRQNIAIDSYNEPLLNAEWHYQTEIIEGTIEWNAEDVEFKGATAYVIANGSAQTPRFTVKDADGNVVDASNYTYEYRENTNAGTGYVIVTFRDGYSGECRGWFKIYLPATTKTWVENVSDGIKVGWEPVEGAAGYVIYRRAWSTTTNGWTEFKRWNNTTETTYIDGKDEAHKVYAGTRYQYGVKAYFARRTDPVSGALIGGNVGDNYNLGEVGPLKTTVRITTRKLVQVRPGKKEMTVKWEKSKNFTGYQIQIATDSAFKQNTRVIKIDNWETYWTTVRDLNSNTTYYVRIRSYQEFEGMTYFGEWSNVISCKTN